MTPLFWGGSLPSPAFLPRPQHFRKPQAIEADRGKRLRRIALSHTPPSVRVASWYGLGGIKNALSGSLSRWLIDPQSARRGLAGMKLLA